VPTTARSRERRDVVDVGRAVEDEQRAGGDHAAALPNPEPPFAGGPEDVEVHPDELFDRGVRLDPEALPQHVGDDGRALVARDELLDRRPARRRGFLSRRQHGVPPQVMPAGGQGGEQIAVRPVAEADDVLDGDTRRSERGQERALDLVDRHRGRPVHSRVVDVPHVGRARVGDHGSPWRRPDLGGDVVERHPEPMEPLRHRHGSRGYQGSRVRSAA
jgi:hypothetical protein